MPDSKPTEPRPLMIWQKPNSRHPDWTPFVPWLWKCRVCHLQNTFTHMTLANAYADAMEHLETEHHEAATMRTRIMELQRVAAKMLQAFVHPTYPGTPCMQSRHVDLAEIGRWRAVVWPTPQRILEK